MNKRKYLAHKQLTAWLARRTAQSGLRRVAPLLAAVASEIGNVRSENQDRSLIARGFGGTGAAYTLLAIADGIGGMSDGSRCASLALGGFVAEIEEQAKTTIQTPKDWLKNALKIANNLVKEEFSGLGGTTLSALLMIEGMSPVWLSVGDSRVYVLKTDGLKQLSVDETIAGQLGQVSATNSEKNLLLQFVGTKADLEPQIEQLELNGVEAILLTTDGAHYLSKIGNLVEVIFRNGNDPGVIAKRIVELSKWCGGSDNASLAIMMPPTLPVLKEWPESRQFEVWDAHGELQLIDTSSIYAKDLSRQPEEVLSFFETPPIKLALFNETNPILKTKVRRLPTSINPKKSKELQIKVAVGQLDITSVSFDEAEAFQPPKVKKRTQARKQK